MRLCRHDWFVHKIQEGHSLRHDLIIGSTEIPWITIALCYGIGFAGLYLTPLPVWAVIPSALVIGIFVLGILCITMGEALGSDYDPWRAKDKSCLKCGKIRFDATKNQDKINKRIEARRTRDAARQVRLDAITEKKRVAEILRKKNLKLAQGRYKELLEEYQKD